MVLVNLAHYRAHALASFHMTRFTHFRCPRVLRFVIERLLWEESGQDLIEYSLLLTLVGLAVIAAVDHVGDALFFAFMRMARSVATGQANF